MLDPLLRYALAAAIAATAGRGLVRRGQHAALFPAPAGLLDAALDHGDSKFGRTSRTEVLGSLAARIDENGRTTADETAYADAALRLAREMRSSCSPRGGCGRRGAAAREPRPTPSLRGSGGTAGAPSARRRRCSARAAARRGLAGAELGARGSCPRGGHDLGGRRRSKSCEARRSSQAAVPGGRGRRRRDVPPLSGPAQGRGAGVVCCVAAARGGLARCAALARSQGGVFASQNASP